MTFTTDEEFNAGFKINVEGAEVGDGELRIKTEPEPLPQIWVACSKRGTIVRIATSTFDPLTGQTVEPGDVLGEYWSSPDACRPTLLGDPKGPSRTTVDFDGDVWAGNRHNVSIGGIMRGHVVKVGSGFAFQWKDRDNDTVLNTSATLGDLKAWPDDGDGDCTAADLAEAQDELVMLYREVPATTVRLVAVDRENNVWVGGTQDDRLHGRLDGQTGQTQFGVGFFDWDTSFSCTQCVECPDFSQCTDCGQCAECEECVQCPACFECPECVSHSEAGGYGGLVDRHGFLWAADGGNPSDRLLLRFRPHPDFGIDQGESDCIAVPRSYGVGIDTQGDIWVSRWEDLEVREIDIDDPLCPGTDFDVGFRARGVAVSPLAPAPGHVWVANSFDRNVTRLDRDGELPDFSGNILLEFDEDENGTIDHFGLEPTGVAVDADGFIWVTNRNSHDVMVIEPRAECSVTTEQECVRHADCPQGESCIDKTAVVNRVDLNTVLDAQGQPIPHPEGDCEPYNYSDMTGMNLMYTVAPAGTWSAVVDSGASGTFWGTVSWVADLSGHSDNTLHVAVRAADVETDLGKEIYQDVENGVPFTCLLCSDQTPGCEVFQGRFLQVRVQLNGMSHDPLTWPTLQQITVQPRGDDCNGNNVPDECDILRETSNDCTGNGVPDECDVADDPSPADCNGNSVPDLCELHCGLSGGACDVPGCGTEPPDCNANCAPDVCDLAVGGASCDIDEDGIPDECAACCNDVTGCTNRLPENCTGASEQPYYGVTCEECGCSTFGGCCFDSTCEPAAECQCLARGGTFAAGQQGCSPNPCMEGACCGGVSPPCYETGVGTCNPGYEFQPSGTCNPDTCDELPSVWCPTASFDPAADTDPASGTKDARQPHPRNDNSFAARQGIGSPNTYAGGPEPITIELSMSGTGVECAGHGKCWDLCETGIEPIDEQYPPFLNANLFRSITETDPGVYEILLDRPISGGYWTTISYLGDATGASTAEYASLPCDANNDDIAHAVTTSCESQGELDDAYFWAECCFEHKCPNPFDPPPFGHYSCDIDHDDDPRLSWDFRDLAALVDMLKGNGTWYEWQCTELLTNTCSGGGGQQAMSGGEAFASTAAQMTAADRFVDFVTTATVPPGRTEYDLRMVILTLAEFHAETMTEEEKGDLTRRLRDRSTRFETDWVADMLPELVAMFDG